MRRPAAFLDRDGVINRDIGYPHRPDQIEWIEGVFDALRRLAEEEFLVFVVTNQAGIARGLYSEADVEALHRWMADEIGQRGGRIDDFRYSPYHPDHDDGRYAPRAHWRKPEPGMILDLAEHWPVDFSRSFLIGDRASDIAAAEAAGLPGHLFEGGNLHEFLEKILPRRRL